MGDITVLLCEYNYSGLISLSFLHISWKYYFPMKINILTPASYFALSDPSSIRLQDGETFVNKKQGMSSQSISLIASGSALTNHRNWNQMEPGVVK